jgi:dihydrodipicolinate synthase/N-acetylneuraminate lyase
MNIAEGATREALQQAANAKSWGAHGIDAVATDALQKRSS